MAEHASEPQVPERPDPNLPHYGYTEVKERLLSDPDDKGPSPTGEEIKEQQAAPEGSPEKEEERTRLDPETGETLLPESAAKAQEASLQSYQRAAGSPIPRGEEGGISRADVVEQRQVEQREGGNPAMLGVGRNIREEQVELVRAADLPGEGVDLGRKFFDGEYGGPGEGAPVALPSQGQRHHMGAPWPAPLSTASRAPSPSPEPGPEPDQQWHPPQDVVFADHDAAVRGTMGPDAAAQRQAAREAVERGSMPGRTSRQEPPATARTGFETSGGPDDPEAQKAARGPRPGTTDAPVDEESKPKRRKHHEEGEE